MSKKYTHTSRVLVGAEANRLMKRLFKMYQMLEHVEMRSQFYLVAKHIGELEHDFAQLGYMPREDDHEIDVRISEYKNLNRRMAARS